MKIPIEKELLETIYAQLCGIIIERHCEPDTKGYKTAIWESKEQLKKILQEHHKEQIFNSNKPNEP